MFNGYNDSALISYEFNQEREKLGNVSKYTYGYDGGVQSTPTHPNNRQSEFWSGKPNFVGIHNVVKCNCTGCFPAPENQSYQVQSAHHRPWLPKTHSVPSNGSNESKLPAYQWDNALNQICYSDSNMSYGQENGGKHSYYRQFQNPNQPGVIISTNKQKSEMGFQNGVRQQVMCNPGYDLTKRVNGRNYYDGDKCSLGAHSVNQIPRLPVEPYIKAVPSNLNQNRVPSTGHRKGNSSQCDVYSGTKLIPDGYHTGLPAVDLKSSGIHMEYPYFNRDPDFYRSNYTEIKRNNLAVQNRKDCSLTPTNFEQHYGRSKHLESLKSEMFYPNLEKTQVESCIQRIENDGMDCLARSVSVCNDLRYADERPQMYPYQNNAGCRNYVKADYPQFNAQCVSGFQETDQNQCRILSQQLQSFDQQSQGNSGCFFDSQKGNSDKIQSYGRTQITVDSQPKPSFLETIRSEELTKSATNKISPLRLLRKKKIVTPPQELFCAANTLETPTLDVRKFWSTWAEEDENVSPTQMVVLDCQNIDPEQAKLLNFCETDPSRPLNFENVILKNSDLVKNNIDDVKANEEPVAEQDKRIEITTQMEPAIKSGDEVISDFETTNTSPKKYKTHELRKKKMEDVMDKWTEKKFDFLKKSEESKAAEIIRYEEEKKKIFERRLSFQQLGIKKVGNSQEDELGFEENSQSNSPEAQSVSDLPTSEYRRNKFLHYSEVIVNGKDHQKMQNTEVNQSSDASVVKIEEPDKKQEVGSALEVGDILKKITEINFQETKLESGLDSSKKGKKTKKKKLDQLETDAKTDLKLETVTKPTIKFSIQKSQDLKISFKVLNKKYEEEVQSEETKPVEDVNTELITLKYKSIQNGGKLSDLKKNKEKLRRKKHASTFKMKKNKYTEEELDPLAEIDAKTYSADDFHVQETVDSAKIKLTFKRQKNNFETQYRVDNEGLNMNSQDHEKNFEGNENRFKKKFKKAKKHKTFVQTDIEASVLKPESTKQDLPVFSNSECIDEKHQESTEEHSENSSSTSHLSCSSGKEKTNENFTIPFAVISPEKPSCKLIEESNCEMSDKKQFELMVGCDEANGSDGKYDKFSSCGNVEEAISKSSENGKAKEELQGISLDFIRTINSPDIETHRETEKTEEIENRDLTEGRNENGGVVIESTNKNHSILESSYDFKKNLVCLEIQADLRSILPDKKNNSLQSDAYLTNGTLNEDVSKIWRTESQNIYSLETNTGDQPEKSVADNFEKYDTVEGKKNENIESDFEKNVEFEPPKIFDKEAKIEFENMFLKRVNSKEDVKSEADNIHNSKPFQLTFYEVRNKENSESFEMKPDSPLMLDESIHHSQTETPRLNSNEIDKWSEPDEVTTEEKDLRAENLELFCDQSNKNSVTENKSDLECQNLPLPELNNDELKTFTGDQTKGEWLPKDEQKTLQSKPEKGTYYEKESKLYEPDSVEGQDSQFCILGKTYSVKNEKIELNNTSNVKSVASGLELVEGKSVIDQIESEINDLDSHLMSENCYKNTSESETTYTENINQRVELINVGNESQSLSIDQLSLILDRVNEESSEIIEQEMEVTCACQNPPSNETEAQVTNFSQTDEFAKCNVEVNSNDKKIINKPQIELELSIQNDQNVESTSQINPKNFPQLAEGKTELKEPKEAGHFDNILDKNVPEICSHDPDDFFICKSTIANKSNENNLEVVTHPESEIENCEQMVIFKKAVEEYEQSEIHFLKENLTLMVEDEKPIVENNNQLQILTVDHLRINSSTDETEIKLNEETNLVNALPQLNKLESNFLEISSNVESELEDGEIIDNGSDDLEFAELSAPLDVRKATEFKIQKPVRRHSVHFFRSKYRTSSSWCQRKFNKSKSCSPRLEFKSFDLQLNIPVKDIPLPVGPPPFGSCYNFCKIIQEENLKENIKKKSESPLEGILKTKEKEIVQEVPCGSPFGAVELQNCRNPSPPCIDAFGAPRNKIKFTFTKRSRFAKIGLHSGKLKFLEKSVPNIIVPKMDVDTTEIKSVKKSELEVIKTAEKPEVTLSETAAKTVLTTVENSTVEKPHPEISTQEEIQLKIFEPTEQVEMNADELVKPQMKVLELLQNSEAKDVTFADIVEMKFIDPIENVRLEIIEPDNNTANETEIHTNKIRTLDLVSETVETKKSQIEEVPNTVLIHTNDKDGKSDFEVESLCEGGNVEIVDVLSDFMRDEFYEDIPTSEDLPNGDSVDEKVNDDKFRNIMQNCLENAKKFLNVGNLKLFSCSVDDLLELDNQENESAAANHISRDVLLTSCEDTNDDLSLNEKFQPMDISMEFVPSDVCPEILPVDNWPYLEEEVPSSPLKLNETDVLLENTISEVVPNRKRAAKDSENYKRFRRKSLIDDEEMHCSKIAAHRRKTIDEFNNFLSYTKLNGIDKPNESLKCRLSLEKLTKNGMEFIYPRGNFSKKMKDLQPNKKLNYKSPLWQPKVMLFRISEKEVKRFKKIRIESRTDENLNSLPTIKKHKSEPTNKGVKNDVILSIPPIDSIKELINTSSGLKKHKPRFRNLHSKEKPEQGQTQPKAIETASSEIFEDFGEESKHSKPEKTSKNVKIAEERLKSERDLLKCHSHKDKHDHRDRRRESDREHHRHKEKRKHERSKLEERKRRKSYNSDDDRSRSVSNRIGGRKEAWVCEVCGFDDVSERVTHIKNHPFHCQSCHLAFKAEAYFNNHLTEKHKDIRNQHHCLLCELSFDTEEEYQRHLETREHTHLEAVEKNTINTLFTLLTGAPCPVLGLVEVKPEWLPNQPGTVHFYHQATPLSLALQYLKMHRDLTPHSEASKLHPN